MFSQSKVKKMRLKFYLVNGRWEKVFLIFVLLHIKIETGTRKVLSFSIRMLYLSRESL